MQQPLSPHQCTQQLLDQLASLDALIAAIGAVVERHDPERRKLLVEYRRRLTKEIGDVERSAEAFVEGDPGRRAIRDIVSRLRLKIAYHQAAWPAVAIDDSDDYRQSGREVIAAYEVFSTILRQAVSEARQRSG